MAETEVLEDYTSKLPEHIIHHILSFLRFSSEAAVQTSLLSKAWLKACRTRPNLSFRYREVSPRKEDTSIIDFYCPEKRCFYFIQCIDSTLQKYHEHKNSIDSLELTLPSVLQPDYVNRWIQIAVENGLKSLELFMSRDSCCSILPRSVFEAKTLVALRLGKLQLKPYVINSIRCNNLTKLSLSEVDLDEVMFGRIMSSCPLIESMTVCCCVGLVNIKVTKLNKLREFSVFQRGSGCVDVGAPSLEEFICNGRRLVQIYASKNLKVLRLSHVVITEEFFKDIAEKFPRLVKLNITDCRDLKRIGISSHSIKCIHLEWNEGLKEGQIDVPSINVFKYRGNNIPRFSFTENSFGFSWVSEIVLFCGMLESFDISWFSKLKDFLTKLQKSQISLRLDFSSIVERDIVDEMISSATIFPLPQVKSLTICFHGIHVLNAADLVLDAIFWTCRPKTIFQDWFQGSDWNSTNTNPAKVIFDMMMFRRKRKHIYLQKISRFWQQDLKDVKVVKCKNHQGVQLPDSLDWNTLLKLNAANAHNRHVPYNYELELEWKTFGFGR
ncbi:hypothetical protein ACH5RR_032971 [Cinchona calisaya]|uniref:F-box domain-containing protein n=1 Tax=Cinchona calisaya TaxID=153742 RepID=A0ABD2YM07_9GENT